MRTCAWALAIAVAVTACGPINATNAISRAEEAIAAARKAGAETAAPYEWTESVLLLDMAMELEGRAEFQAADRMATRAERLAREGTENAARNRRQKELREAAAKAAVPPAGAQPATPGKPSPAPEVRP